MKKVVVLGGLGFIGRELCRRLAEKGHSVLAIDSLSPQIHGDIPVVAPPEGVRVVRLDVRSIADHWKLLDGTDAVFHLAAETGTAQSMYRIQHYVGVNELGTAALLEALSKCSSRPAAVFLSSSRSVYGEGAYVSRSRPDLLVQPGARGRAQLDAGQWEPVSATGEQLVCVATPESLPFAPGSVYAATKASQELLLASAADALGFKDITFRFQNVYGEGQSLQNPYTGIISIFFNRARQGLEIPLYEDGLESRDFVHVTDVVAAMIAGLEGDVAAGTIINVGSGRPTSVSELASVLLKAAGLVVPVRVTGQFRVGDIRHCFADIQVARSVLGFVPQISLEEGLGRFVRWAHGQPVHEDMSAKAVQELRERGLSN
jgi:dTDP-L-rhamnose 4-epimerase